MKSFIIVLILLVSTGANAGELIINVASLHINSSVNYNQNNFGLGYRSDNNLLNAALEIGFFRNSFYDKPKIFGSNGNGYTIYFKGSVIEARAAAALSFGIDAGIAFYGKDGPNPILPILQAIAKINITKSLAVNLGILPHVQDTYVVENDVIIKSSRSVGLLTLNIAYKF